MGGLGLAPVAGVLTLAQTGSFIRFDRYLQPLSAPQPLDPFAVHVPVLLFELGGDPPVAITGMLLGEFVEASNQFSISLATSRVILLRASRLTECPASSPFTHAQLAADVSYNVTLLAGR